jgi:hypothetical protein
VSVREVRVTAAAACPRCDAGPHQVVLAAKVTRGTLLFGGPDRPPTVALATVTVRCPTTGKPFELTVDVPVNADERVESASVESASVESASAESAGVESVGVQSAAAPSSNEPVAVVAALDWRADEFAQWRKDSASTGRSAAEKLLAAGTAAVAAYFAVLKVVAGDPVGGADRALAISPAVGYLLTTVLAAVALRPSIRRVYDLDSFERLREARLKRMSGLISASVSVFVLSTVLAVIAWSVLLP